jgi:hypothetical protein
MMSRTPDKADADLPETRWRRGINSRGQCDSGAESPKVVHCPAAEPTEPELTEDGMAVRRHRVRAANALTPLSLRDADDDDIRLRSPGIECQHAIALRR